MAIYLVTNTINTLMQQRRALRWDATLPEGSSAYPECEIIRLS